MWTEMENVEQVPHEEAMVGEEPLETEQQQQQEEVFEAFGPLEEGAIYSLGDGSASGIAPEQQEGMEDAMEPSTVDTTHAGCAAEVSVVSGVTLDEAGITQFLEVGDIDEGAHFERDLQQWLALKEEEAKNMAAQLVEVESHRHQQAQEFAAEIEQLKQQHSEEIENALAASTEAQEELKNAEAKYKEELERALAESESKHREEVEFLRAQLEKETEVEGRESIEKEGSLIPRQSPQLSPRGQKELRLQRERLSRQHRSELKAQEQKLRGEFALQSEALQSRLEEEFTANLAEAVTDSALKNAAQVEEISRDLRLEKQRAVEELEREQEERHRQEMARLSQERQEAVEACKAELESARAEYQGRVSVIEEAMGSEREKETLSEGEEWKEREETLRGEMEAKYLERVEEIRRECARDKEASLETLRRALEGGLHTELRRAQDIHKQTLVEQRAQLQTDFEGQLLAAHETIQTLQGELLRVGQQEGVNVEEAMAQAAEEQAVKYEEMSAKLREVHRAELVALEAGERGRHQEEVESLREDFETRLHQELEEVSLMTNTHIIVMYITGVHGAMCCVIQTNTM